jgi:membrane fusion protein, multidrug efflux system
MSTEAVLDTSIAEAAAPRRRSPVRLVLAGMAVLALGGWGIERYRLAQRHVTSDNAQVDGPILTVAPKVQAFVAEVLVNDNQPVRLGDTLVRLDDRDFRIRLSQAEAELANAVAAAGSTRSTGQAQAQLAWSEAQAQSAEATIAQAEAALRKAQADLDRIRGLAEKRIVAAQQLDAAQAAFDVASANLEAARRQASAATSQVSAYGAGVGAAEARLAAARAAVANARLQLSYTVITAPATGSIGRRRADPGNLVQVGQTLMEVIPEHDVWVTANLKETELAHVGPGDRVTFTVDAYRDRTFTGHVESLSPATGARFALLPPDNATGNFTKVVQRVPVRIAVDGGEDETHRLRSGMSVVVDIQTQ